ncbi:MAG: PD-(D/E)XK nuclease family protein [Angelakisella sp.]
MPGTTLIMGAVDAVLVEEDHAVLLDYKTDRVAAPQELTGRYALQLKLYAAMVRRQFGLPVTEAVLYSFCLGQAVKVEL